MGDGVSWTCVHCAESCAESWLRAAALRETSRAGAVGSRDVVAVVVGDFHRDHQQHVVEKMNRPICFRVDKLLLKCMLMESSLVVALVGTDLLGGFLVGMRQRSRRAVSVGRARAWIGRRQGFGGCTAFSRK